MLWFSITNINFSFTCRWKSNYCKSIMLTMLNSEKQFNSYQIRCGSFIAIDLMQSKIISIYVFYSACLQFTLFPLIKKFDSKPSEERNEKSCIRHVSSSCYFSHFQWQDILSWSRTRFFQPRNYFFHKQTKRAPLWD